MTQINQNAAPGAASRIVFAAPITLGKHDAAHRDAKMDIRRITDAYSVCGQITAADVPAIAEAGFRLVICNRPDMEVSPAESTTVLRAAVESAGMKWAENSFSSNTLTIGNVETQRELMDAAEGPVFAYCRTGSRCANIWALAEAGQMDTDAIIAAAGAAGYAVDRLRPTIEALAAQRGS